jgi:hypothetical protein
MQMTKDLPLKEASKRVAEKIDRLIQTFDPFEIMSELPVNELSFFFTPPEIYLKLKQTARACRSEIIDKK